MAWRIGRKIELERTTASTHTANGAKESQPRCRHSEKAQTMLITPAARKHNVTGMPKSCKTIDRRCAAYTVNRTNQITDTITTNLPRRDICRSMNPELSRAEPAAQDNLSHLEDPRLSPGGGSGDVFRRQISHITDSIWVASVIAELNKMHQLLHTKISESNNTH